MASDVRWRVGSKLGRTLYRNEVCVGMVDSSEIAAEIVEGMNAVAPARTEAEDYDLQAGWPGLSLEQARAIYPAAARTEVEQRVLDAMGRLDEMQLQMVAEDDDDGFWTMAAAAELARRELKP